MNYFRYQYTDTNGQVLEGTVQAKNSQAAEDILSQRGVQGFRMLHPGNAIAAADMIRTPKGKDNQRHFIFAQISRLLNAGINPAKAFEELAKVSHQQHFRQSFLDLKVAAENGKSLSEVFVRYPDLYPDHVVATVHAAELGGYLPEAFSVLSDQAGAAHKFKRFHWFIWAILPYGIIAIPLVLAVRQALIQMSRLEETPGNPFLTPLIKAIAWPYGPMCLAIAMCLLLIRGILSTYEARRIRHSVGLKVPVYGARARNESIAIFTWVLSRLARSGIPPKTSWQLATEAVPNLEMADRLRSAGSMMNDGTRISEVVFGSKLFPEEYAPMISTGELTGDMEGTLNQLERASRAEFETSSTIAKVVSFRMGCVATIVIGGILLCVFTYAWYNDFYSGILDNFKTD